MLDRELQIYTNKEEYHELFQKYTNEDNILQSIRSVSHILQDL
jgi:hypothetical protein